MHCVWGVLYKAYSTTCLKKRPGCKITFGATDSIKRKTLLRAWWLILCMNDICTSQTVSPLWFNALLPSERTGMANQLTWKRFQLRAITAQFTLATLYVAPLQHLINTMRNRESYCVCWQLRSCLSIRPTVSDCLGNLHHPCWIAICSFIKSSHRHVSQQRIK